MLSLFFYSCNNDEFVSDSSEYENGKFVSEEQMAKLLAEMVDTRVFNIETEKDLNELCSKAGEQRRQELLNNGYTKIEEKDYQLRASVQQYSVQFHPYGTTQILSSNFKSKFSKSFCDEINLDAVNKINPDKTYICNWREASVYFNLASNQSGGPLPSPQAALIPSTKSGYSQRGYEAFVNSHNQYILISHQLEIYCEDVNKPTIIMEIRYPYWDRSTGYVFNYAVLTR